MRLDSQTLLGSPSRPMSAPSRSALHRACGDACRAGQGSPHHPRREFPPAGRHLLGDGDLGQLAAHVDSSSAILLPARSTTRSGCLDIFGVLLLTTLACTGLGKLDLRASPPAIEPG